MGGSCAAHGAWLGKKLDALNPDNLTGLLAQVDAGWNEQCTETARERIAPYWLHLPCLARHKGLKRRSEDARLRWAQRYGQVTLRNDERGWRFHPALGFTKRR